MAAKKFNHLTDVDTAQVAGIGRDIAIRHGKEMEQAADYILLGSLSYITREKDIDSAEELQKDVDDSVKNYSVKARLLDFVGKNWDVIKDFSNAAGQKELKAVSQYLDPAELNYRSCENSTPYELSMLGTKILDLNAEDTLLEHCAGIGGFLAVVAAEKQVARAIGIEYNRENQVVANVRAFIANNAFEVEQGDVLTQDYKGLEANKVFSHPPMGVRRAGVSEKLYPRLKERLARTRPSQRLDWEYTLSALCSQREGGKTVVVVPDGMLFSIGRDIMLRKQLTDEGRLEAVISLPSGILAGTGVKISLLVFSENNWNVNMVDASEMGVRMKGRTKLSLADIDQIVFWYGQKSDSEHNKIVDLGQMEQKDYTWMPSAYFRGKLSVLENPEKLGDLAEVCRGGNIKSSQLEDWASDEPTEYQYIMLKHIENNEVSDNLPYLKEIDEKHQKSLLQAGDLLISRTAPFKVAIMPETGTKVLANGNLYYLRFKSDKVNPTYAMMFLNSERGRQALDAFSKGMTLSMLSLKDLADIEIPVISMEKQREMVKQYEELSKKLRQIRTQENAVMEKMTVLMNGCGRR
ncbi:N-6 DNA methylase [Selenomonas sp. WCA-380-WT-3B 3/]|uniref:site-specific DNA-methyltransferase (adenine-specific) n=1 Tax=Selenomonas montiformis TaxID=2652285 RepID=A0A6I2UNL6_9FIRM|nr:N-6 DNA methylase [Selenomonas montiformis]MSV23783.1 N-6 DNA methylase [Selenomonas montiformis]